MEKRTPDITIDMDRACQACGKPGATDGGLCLKCVTKKLENAPGANTMPRDYEESEVVKRMATRMIEEHHEHLRRARIAYVMKKVDEEKEPAPAKPGRFGKARKIARARLVPAMYCLLTGCDFIIEVDEEVWNRLSLEQHEAVIDHELCHCMKDEKGWYVRDHDVEEFRAIIDRHGFWKESLHEFAEASVYQMNLPLRQAEGSQAVQ